MDAAKKATPSRRTSRPPQSSRESSNTRPSSPFTRRVSRRLAGFDADALPIDDDDELEIRYLKAWGCSCPICNPPENPASLENPENPANPANPENPENPANPANPENPENPANPANPGNPENPANPANPANPENPANEATNLY